MPVIPTQSLPSSPSPPQVAHFCGEPEEEEVEEDEAEGREEEGGIEGKGQQQSLPLDFLPAMRKATSLSFGKVHSPSPPPSPLLRGMVRTQTSRRRSLMETYRVRSWGGREGRKGGGREGRRSGMYVQLARGSRQ